MAPLQVVGCPGSAAIAIRIQPRFMEVLSQVDPGKKRGQESEVRSQGSGVRHQRRWFTFRETQAALLVTAFRFLTPNPWICLAQEPGVEFIDGLSPKYP